MKILAFGEVMMRLMPSDYKMLSQVNELEFLFTGTGMNILSGLYQMGEDVYLSTCLPDNPVGQAASAHIRKIGIHDEFLQYHGDHIGIYFLEKGIGNRASQVTYLNRKDSSFGQSELSHYDFSCLDGMDALHICGISLAFNERIRNIAFTFAKEAKKRNVKVIFDCNFRPSLWQDIDQKEIQIIYKKMLKISDIVFAGYKDATLLLHMKTHEELSYVDQLKELLSNMCKEYQIEVIFGTQRSNNNQEEFLQGFMVTKDEITVSSQFQLTVYDRVGGGDGFAAGAIYGYLHNIEMGELINYATVSGLLAHTVYGDSPLSTKDDILDYMKNGKSDIKR